MYPLLYLIYFLLLPQIEAEFYGLKDLMFPPTSSSSLSSTKSQGTPRSTRSQSNPPEPPSQTTPYQSNFPVKSHALFLHPPPLHYIPSPLFVPASTHAATQYQPSTPLQPSTQYHPASFAPAPSQATTQYHTSSCVQQSGHVSVPPVIVPCKKTGTHIIISQGEDHTSKLSNISSFYFPYHTFPYIIFSHHTNLSY